MDVDFLFLGYLWRELLGHLIIDHLTGHLQPVVLPHRGESPCLVLSGGRSGAERSGR